MLHRTATLNPDPVDLAAIEAAVARGEAALAGDLPATVETVAKLVSASIAAWRLVDALDPPGPVAGRITAANFRRLERMAVIAEEILGPRHRAVDMLRRALGSRHEVDLQLAQEDLRRLPKSKLLQIVGLLQAIEAGDGGAV